MFINLIVLILIEKNYENFKMEENNHFNNFMRYCPNLILDFKTFT